MKRICRSMSIGLMSFLLACPALAQPMAGSGADSDADALERWQRMAPEEKQDMRERFQRWQNLPPEGVATPLEHRARPALGASE